MFSQPGGRYDRNITQFSPEGRLFQVEYAIEAVRRGATAIALRNKDGVIFAVEKKNENPLKISMGSEKIFKIDDHIGATIAGLTADARQLIDKARVQAQINIFSYDEKITVMDVTREICDHKQYYTQHAVGRPFGVSLLIGGIDKNGPQLYMTDPSGAYWGYFCCAIGANQDDAKKYLKENYKKDLSFEDLMKLARDTLKDFIEEFNEDKYDLAYIKMDTKKFHLLTLEEKKELISK